MIRLYVMKNGEITQAEGEEQQRASLSHGSILTMSIKALGSDPRLKIEVEKNSIEHYFKLAEPPKNLTTWLTGGSVMVRRNAELYSNSNGDVCVDLTITYDSKKENTPFQKVQVSGKADTAELAFAAAHAELVKWFM